MRTSTIVASLFAGLALAGPINRRDVVEVVDYQTDIVTVTAGQAPPPTVVTVTAGAPPPAAQTSETHAPAAFYAAPSSSSQAPAPAAASPSSAPATGGSPPSGYNDLALWHHNQHRANHSAPDLTWSDSLASTAQKIASTCNYAHNVEMDGGGYGQNIAAGVDASKIGTVISDMFYNGEVGYYQGMYGSEPNMAQFENWGHFSQIVWKDTTTVGCATQSCPSLAGVASDCPPIFTVCNYGPAGNVGGEYAANILAPKGLPTVSG